MPAQLLDLGDERLRHMDEAGIDVQVLSFGAARPAGLRQRNRDPIARDANQQLYEAINAHPNRFAGFAALPMADPEQAARELERAVNIWTHPRRQMSAPIFLIICFQARFVVNKTELAPPCL